MSWFLVPLLLAAAQLPGDEDLAARFGDRLTTEARVYQMAGPAVVSIDVAGTVRSFGPFRPSATHTSLGQGTGVVIDPSGLVITNAHVAVPQEQGLDPESIEIEVSFGSDFGAARHPAKLLSLDREWDLALLKIEAPGPFRFIPIEDSGELLIGEKVITIGTPFGNEHSITSGILSGKRRDVVVRTPSGGRAQLSGLIQTDAAINPGNSGGPLLNAYGQLIGINSATLIAADGIGYAIPVDRVREILGQRLLDADRSSRFWSGMRVRETAAGLEVTDLHPRGPAALAGLATGDRILSVDGEAVATLQDYAARLLEHDAGDGVVLRAERDGGRPREFGLRLRGAAERETFGLLGFEARPDSITYRRGWQSRTMRVLRLTRVFPGTSAERLGLEPGDIVVAVRTRAADEDAGWTPVRSMPELVSLVRGPDFRLDADNIWILRENESFQGRLVFDDPDLAARLRER